MRKFLQVTASFVTALVILSACSDGGTAPAEDVFDGLPELGTFFAEDVIPVERCYTADFESDPFDHAYLVTEIPVPFGDPIQLTLEPGLDDQALRIYSAFADGPDPDLEEDRDCPGCAALGNMLVIGDPDWLGEGDSPEGGEVVMSGFPATGTTYIKTYDTADQDDGELGIEFFVDAVLLGSPDDVGDGEVQTVTPKAFPNLGDADDVRFKWNGSGATDNIQFCYLPPPADNPGTGTQGYWRNHPDAWPVSEIWIGGMLFPMRRAIALMDAPGKGDKTFNMFEQLVSAKLNVMIGNDDSCISEEIALADRWMNRYPVGSKVKAKNDAWKMAGSYLHGMLDDYNNGRLCAPHRDSF